MVREILTERLCLNRPIRELIADSASRFHAIL
jgi:hypothetical protein